MTTTMRPSGLRGWSIRVAIIAMSVAFCAPAFAGSESTASQPKTIEVAQKATHKLCYVRSGWAIPQPCDRFAGPVPTTASPIEIIGRMPR
jgi:hypothetical protein